MTEVPISQSVQRALRAKISRRRLLQLGGLGGLAALTTDCGAPQRDAPPTTPTTAAPPTTADWAALSEKLSGRLCLPASPAYALDRELYGPEYDAVRPAGIAYCTNATDVARCIVFARQRGMALAARSGGHSYGGYSTTTGLVIDVSPMSQVTAPATSRRLSPGRLANVGAGARLIDVYSDLARQGLSVPAGSCPTVGVVGLALGGGIGVMDRLHGLTCDHIVSLEIVTAAGEVVQADARTNPDLYWACRGGGGGNFGVVTRLGFSTFETTDLCLFDLSWPWSAAGELLPAWMEWVAGAPDAMWSNCLMETSAAPTPSVQVTGVWAGNQSGAQSQLAKLVGRLGPPSSQVIGQNGFEDAMYIEAGCQGISQVACHLAGKRPGGTLLRTVTVAKSDILNKPLSAEGVQAVLAGLEERQGQGGPGGVIFDSWGGAINRVAPDATAFVHREAIASAQYIATFPPAVAPSAVAAARAWMQGWYASLRPYVSGQAYQNYIDPDLAGWAKAYYGANLERLERVKARWDPDDIFHFAQGVPLPSGPRSIPTGK